MKESRDDSFNTRKASQEVVKVLNGIKREFPVDHTILRNAVVAGFKQQGQMLYIDFIEKVFANYQSDDSQLMSKLPAIIGELKALPQKKNFDSQFNLVPSEVRFRRLKVELTNEITLSLDEGIADLENKIWAEKSADGKKLVVIDSPKGFEQFVYKERLEE